MINRLLFGLLIILFISCNHSLPNRQWELKLKWQFTEAGSDNWLLAVVPGSVQEDLLRNKMIPDPFVEANEDSVQWVEDRDWIYKTNLNVSEELLAYDHLELIFKGLDTYANVYLNDNLIIEAENMFLAYQYDIRNLVKKGANELRIELESPINHNRNFVNSLPYKLPSSELASVNVSSVTRKAAYQFGWDFAPRIVTMGIWQPIQLEAWSDVKIRDVVFTTRHISDTLAIYNAQLNITTAHKGTYSLNVNGNEAEIELVKGDNVINQEFDIADPVLWWPNGLGDQHLYNVTATLYNEEQVLDSDTIRLGVRTVILKQEEDERGTSFKFEVNGKEVFMKGANWSPLSIYPGSIQDSVYENRLKQVRDAHMNMLRVWGGGIYESDLFYDLCDEYGILVWQDFMFANTMYPPTEEFHELVEKEVRYQLKRLRNHPSIALWNGNNEIEVAWKNWGWQNKFDYSEEDSTILWNNYLDVFHNQIPGMIAEFDANINYTTTSPLSNWGKLENFDHGSMHYWGVWHGNDSFEDYSKYVGRFISEYGFQSYPDLSTFKSYYKQDEFMPDSNKLLHQKSYVGNKLIFKEIDNYFGKAENIEEFVTKSQQTQALAYKLAIESHRLSDRCDGTLFWQLNDCWPGPSWSVVDFYGNKKLAYDVVKDRYQPIILISKSQNNGFSLSYVNDTPEKLNVKVDLELWNYLGERIWIRQLDLLIAPTQADSFFNSDIRKLLDGIDRTKVYLKSTARIGKRVIDIDKFYFVKPKDYLGSIDMIGEK